MNPYQPPNLNPSERVIDASPRFFGSLVPAAIVIGSTLILWVLLVSMVDRRLPHRFSTPFWSFSLFLSSAISMYAVLRVWRKPIQPLAFLSAFTAFGIVFVKAEGDTSSGTVIWEAAIVYGTLAALPFVMFCLAHYFSLKFRPTTRLQPDE